MSGSISGGGRLLSHARELFMRGHHDQAIDVLTRVLGEDPDSGDAHALLSLCLLRRKRLHAARLEAEIAASIDPESNLARSALAAVMAASRKFTDAEKLLLSLIEENPADGDAHAQLARLYRLWNRPEMAMSSAVSACEIDPDALDHWVLRGNLEFDRGDHAAASAHARVALEIDPEHVEALTLLGHCELAAGNTELARQHAAWALHNDPTDEAALTLLAAVKARRSLMLGLWWRFQSFMSAGTQQRTILLLVGMYLAYRTASIALDENGLTHWLLPLSLAWVGFCVYTWVAPGLFWKSVRRELETVRLPDGY